MLTIVPQQLQEQSQLTHYQLLPSLLLRHLALFIVEVYLLVLRANSPTATTYAWAYSGVPVSSTFDTVWANKTGRWTSTVRNTFGCIARDSVWVYEDTSKESIMSPTSAIICLEGSALLTVSPGYVVLYIPMVKGRYSYCSSNT